jgi:hypothetical protein
VRRELGERKGNKSHRRRRRVGSWLVLDEGKEENLKNEEEQTTQNLYKGC